MCPRWVGGLADQCSLAACSVWAPGGAVVRPASRQLSAAAALSLSSSLAAHLPACLRPLFPAPASRVLLQLSQPLVPLVDEFAARLFGELDYIQEGKNAEKFAQLYRCEPAAVLPPVLPPLVPPCVTSGGMACCLPCWQLTPAPVPPRPPAQCLLAWLQPRAAGAGAWHQMGGHQPAGADNGVD